MGAKKWIRNRNFCCHISDAINLKLKQDVNQFPRKEPRTDLFMNIHEVYRSVRFRIIAMIWLDDGDFLRAALSRSYVMSPSLLPLTVLTTMMNVTTQDQYSPVFV